MSEIIVDIHEPEYIKALATRVETLPVDILIIGSERKYAVERKTASDYWASVVDGRLWRQAKELERLRDEEQYIPLILVVGDLRKIIKIHKATMIQYIGMQVALSTFGLTPVHVGNKDAAVLAIRYLATKAGQKPSHPRATLPKPLSRTLEEERIDVLCAFRGIGPVTAEKMLSRWALYEIFNLDKERLVEELGERKAQHFLEVLGRDTRH